MARGEKKAQKTTDRKSRQNGWAALTWDDLDGWAGSRSVSRGRSYQRQGRVRDLAMADDGRLLATVQGGERYTVAVELHAGKKRHDKLASHCTCPVGDNCKHAVATVAAYLEAMAHNTEVPIASDEDPRWDALSGVDGQYEDDLDKWDDDDSDEDDDRGPASRRKRRRTEDWDRKIQELVRGTSQGELSELVLSLVDRFPELREEFRERIALNEGDVKRLVGQARRELRQITSEPAWRNPWNGEGNIPDYSRLKARLERLLKLGHADAVVELGRELIENGMRQVGESHDQGDTAIELADCMPVVFDAVAKSSLTAAAKILFAVDASLADDYNILYEAAKKILNAKWPKSDWSTVADTLAANLTAEAARENDDDIDDFSRNYWRDGVSGWLATALDNAGRQAEVRAVFEAEAHKTGSYERLVRYLLKAGDSDAAECWAKEGIEKTRTRFPGIAANLAQLLCDVATRRKRWDIVAAHAAAEFLEHPSRQTFAALLARAVKAKCEKQVRTAALRFLETGVSPIAVVTEKKGGKSLRIDSDWPLPVPDYLAPRSADESRGYRRAGPHYEVLLEMAIDAKNADDVLRWYDKMTGDRKSNAGVWGDHYSGGGYASQVAAAVAKSHPERALEIYHRGLDANLTQANANAYELAASYLRKLRPILAAVGRKQEWSALLAEIRKKYGNRPRFMEILDKLEGCTILASAKAHRRR